MDLKHVLDSDDIRQIKFGVTDVDGVLRGKILDASKLKKSDHLGFCNVVFGWDINDALYENSQESAGSGFGDEMAQLDPTSGRLLAWDNNVPLFVGDFRSAKGISGIACPRSLLVRLIQKFEQHNLVVKLGAEFEWFNFRETPTSIDGKDPSQWQAITPGMFGYSLLRLGNSSFASDLFELLHASDIPLEGLHTETGPGAYEACIQYSDALKAADRAVAFKLGVKSIAAKHGIIPSFMAKWTADLPGCSGHVHQSLWREGQNLFWDAPSENHMSETMKQYVAGQLHCLPYMVPMFAPFVNSYKRFVAGSWAPTAACWGIENRTVPLRVIPTNESSIRLETRLAGADANPYLSMAACLAAGLYGIEEKLKLPEAVAGDAYLLQHQAPLPNTLQNAIDMMRESDIPKLLFGDAFVDHYIKTRQWECDQFNQAITDWELRRYFEIV